MCDNFIELNEIKLIKTIDQPETQCNPVQKEKSQSSRRLSRVTEGEIPFVTLVVALTTVSRWCRRE